MIDTAALEASAFARAVAVTPGVYPLLSAAHVLGIALLIGPLCAVHASHFGRLGPALAAARGPLLKIALTGFGLAALTGPLLFLVQAKAYLANPAMALKAALLVLAGLNALAFHAAERRGRPVGAFAAASVALWLGVLLAGRFVAFV